jgi:aryl-alcohol dehydrogenase-like predicted oxidoreductase
MEYRNLGRTGVRVSPICLGVMNYGGPTPEQEAVQMTHAALDAGINFFDTANVYNQGESERVIGKALMGGRRQRVILATKFHFPQSEDPNDAGNSRRHIFQAVEDSLRRLGTDWIDLYQVHRPMMDIPQDETLRALDDLVRQGKVRYIGCSTFPAWMLMEAIAISERYNLARYITEQPPYNLLDRRIENELVPLALRYNLGLIPWSPLAMGTLAGRYPASGDLPADSRATRIGSYVKERINQKAIEKGQQVVELARQLDLSPIQLALLWVKDQPAVTAPIIGPRTLSQLQEALPVAEMSLSSEISSAMDEIVPPGSAVADYHNTSGWMKMRLDIP